MITSIPALQAIPAATLAAKPAHTFTTALGDALDGLAASLSQADGLAAAFAVGKGNIAAAAIARAKADVALEIAAVAASRVTGAISVLMQTQV